MWGQRQLEAAVGLDQTIPSSPACRDWPGSRRRTPWDTLSSPQRRWGPYKDTRRARAQNNRGTEHSPVAKLRNTNTCHTHEGPTARWDGAMLSDLATVRAASIVLASGSPRRVDMFNALLKLNARVVQLTFPNPKQAPTPTLTPLAQRCPFACAGARPTQAGPHPHPHSNPNQVPSTFPEDLDKSLYTPESCTPSARTPD